MDIGESAFSMFKKSKLTEENAEFFLIKRLKFTNTQNFILKLIKKQFSKKKTKQIFMIK